MLHYLFVNNETCNITNYKLITYTLTVDMGYIIDNKLRQGSSQSNGVTEGKGQQLFGRLRSGRAGGCPYFLYFKWEFHLEGLVDLVWSVI